MTDTSQQGNETAIVLVADDIVLLRRVPADKKVFDENLNRWRPASDAFCDHRDGSSMSVYDAKSCGGIEAIMANHDGFLLCSFTAIQARAWGMEICRTPMGGPGHCEVVGKKTTSVKNKFAKTAVWVIAPDDNKVTK